MKIEVDDHCVTPCMAQALQVSFGYPGLMVAREVSHCWTAGLCLLQGDEGSGKTSWLKALAGQLALSRGMLHYPLSEDGSLRASACFWKDPRQPLGEAYGHMTVTSWVALQSAFYPNWSSQQFQLHVQGFGLEPHGYKPLQALSSGTLRKLWMAAGWASGAELVLIDEPLAALDKSSQCYVQQALAAMAQDLKRPEQPRCVIVAHWDAMDGVDWDNVMQLTAMA